jgi:MFS family permease
LSSTADTIPPEQISFSAWKTLLILSGINFLVLFVHTSLSPALPRIAQDFAVSTSVSSWVMTAYMVSGAVMTIVIGRFSDIVGAKKMLMLLMICYTVGTIFAGFAHDIFTLIGIRALQGIAIAVTPIGAKLIRDQFPKGKFSIGQSILLSMYSGGMAIGAVLGPIIAAGPGWQSVFYICAPIAVVLLFVSWKFIKVDEGKKIHEHDQLPSDKSDKDRKKNSVDMVGIITMAVAIVSFLLSITFSGSIATNLIAFVLPLAVGVISLILFIIVERRTKSPLVNLKLMFHPVVLSGNITMLMFGVLQYIVITGMPQLGAAPDPSGLGLDPEKVGFLQLPFGLAAMIFGPIFGLLALRKGFNLKLMVPGMVIITISFLLLLLFHATPRSVAGCLFLFGIAGALLPVILTNTIISFTPREYTGISSAATNMMRIVGGAIGPVITSVILASITVSITVENTEKTYPSPVAFNIVFAMAVILAIASVILVIRLKRLATKMVPLTAKDIT